MIVFWRLIKNIFLGENQKYIFETKNAIENALHTPVLKLKKRC